MQMELLYVTIVTVVALTAVSFACFLFSRHQLDMSRRMTKLEEADYADLDDVKRLASSMKMLAEAYGKARADLDLHIKRTESAIGAINKELLIDTGDESLDDISEYQPKRKDAPVTLRQKV